METIKKKDEEIEVLREHQIYLETEVPPKGKRKRTAWEESHDIEKKELKEENQALKTEIEVLRVRLGINKKGPTPSTSTPPILEENKDKKIKDTDISQLNKLFETGFENMQKKLTQIIDEKFMSINISKKQQSKQNNHPSIICNSCW